jgi:hypothetical protein
MNFLDVDMQINDLAEFIFVKNVNNVPIEISMDGIENNKDMYYFCLDLFCKGLILLFSNDGRSVSVEDLTFEDFGIVKTKMSCAGIRVTLDVQEISIETLQNKSLTNLTDIEKEDEHKPLEDYKFILNTIPFYYTISFSLFHNV